MIYGIVGSRKRKDRNSVAKLVGRLPEGSTVVSGGCRGVDAWAAEAARAGGLKVIEILPDLSECSRRWEFTQRYYERNRKIAEACDVLIAFVSADRKGGTENTIGHARDLGKRVFIIGE